MNLVSYDASSSSETSSDEEDDKISSQNSTENSKKKLPLPDLDGHNCSSATCDTATSGIQKNSVFTNPFAKEQGERVAILSKHVKLSDTSEESDKKDKNKDIKYCYKFRKGQCRFGDKCKFAHVAMPERRNSGKGRHRQQTSASQEKKREPELIGDLFNMFDDEEKDSQTVKKKRPGLAMGLVPSKKTLKMYDRHKV